LRARDENPLQLRATCEADHRFDDALVATDKSGLRHDTHHSGQHANRRSDANQPRRAAYMIVNA
jgi:hypothetical protein